MGRDGMGRDWPGRDRTGQKRIISWLDTLCPPDWVLRIRVSFFGQEAGKYQSGKHRAGSKSPVCVLMGTSPPVVLHLWHEVIDLDVLGHPFEI